MEGKSADAASVDRICSSMTGQAFGHYSAYSTAKVTASAAVTLRNGNRKPQSMGPEALDHHHHHQSTARTSRIPATAYATHLQEGLRLLVVAVAASLALRREDQPVGLEPARRGKQHSTAA